MALILPVVSMSVGGNQGRQRATRLAYLKRARAGQAGAAVASIQARARKLTNTTPTPTNTIATTTTSATIQANTMGQLAADAILCLTLCNSLLLSSLHKPRSCSLSLCLCNAQDDLIGGDKAALQSALATESDLAAHYWAHTNCCPWRHQARRG